MIARLITGVLFLVTGWVVASTLTSPWSPPAVKVAAVVLAVWVVAVDAHTVVSHRRRLERQVARLHSRWTAKRVAVDEPPVAWFEADLWERSS